MMCNNRAIKSWVIRAGLGKHTISRSMPLCVGCPATHQLYCSTSLNKTSQLLSNKCSGTDLKRHWKMNNKTSSTVTMWNTSLKLSTACQRGSELQLCEKFIRSKACQKHINFQLKISGQTAIPVMSLLILEFQKTRYYKNIQEPDIKTVSVAFQALTSKII